MINQSKRLKSEAIFSPSFPRNGETFYFPLGLFSGEVGMEAHFGISEHLLPVNMILILVFGEVENQYHVVKN